MLRTAHGYEDPSVRQIAIFLRNRIGELGDVLRRLERAEIVVHAISVTDSVDFAVVRLIVDHVELAKEVLHEPGYSVTESRVLAVRLTDSRDSLLDVCRILLGAELNIHYSYPMIGREPWGPVVILHVDEPTLASETLVKRGFTLYDEKELAGDELDEPGEAAGDA